MTGYEETLLTRAEVLEDAGELVQSITAVLTGAQGAGADPAAVTSLQAAVRALDPGASTGYDAGGKVTRRPAADTVPTASSSRPPPRPRATSWSGYGKRRSCRSRSPPRWTPRRRPSVPPTRCRSRTSADGCDGIKEAAIADALHRIAVCDAAAGILDPLAGRLAAALQKLHQIPEDLGEVYEVVYEFIRKGGRLPVLARWIEGGGPRDR